MEDLIKVREQALNYRHKTQMSLMEKMYENKTVSQKTYQSKKMELEKWVSKERENLRKTKKEIEKGFLKFAEAIK